MQKFTNQVFTRLQTVLADNGVLMVDEEKATEVAKSLGLIEGVRKVGGLRPTDLGFQFAGIPANEIEQAKELAKIEAEKARLTARLEKLSA